MMLDSLTAITAGVSNAGSSDIMMGVALAVYLIKTGVTLIKPKKSALDVGIEIKNILLEMAKGHTVLAENQKEQLKVSYGIKSKVDSLDHTVQKDHAKFGKLVSDVGIIASETSEDAHRTDKNFGLITDKIERVNTNLVDFRIDYAKAQAKPG